MRAAAALALAAALAACGKACPDDFIRACRKPECAAKVKEMLAKKPELIKQGDEANHQPLELAASGAIAEALIDAGADVNMQTFSGGPLSMAIQNDRGDVVKVLLARGAKVYDIGSLLRNAASHNQASTIRALVESGASVDAADSATQATPLHMAVLNDNWKAAEALLELRADPNLSLSAGTQSMSFGGGSMPSDTGGKTCLALAKSDGMRELLKKHGAK